MIICKVCKQENEDHFTYCKNCGTELEKPKAQEPTVVPTATAPSFTQNTYAAPQKAQQPPIVNEKVEVFDLVPVFMRLPDADNPSVRTLQRVYVTKKQYEAMKAAGMFGESQSE